MRDWKGLLAFAARRYNVLHVTDGRRYGISPAAVADRAKREGWARPRRGVVIVPGVDDCHEQRCQVAICAIGGKVLIAGRSVLYVAGVIDKPPPFVEVMIPHYRGARSGQGVLVMRSRLWMAEAGVVIAKLPCTCVERAFIEGGRRMPDDRLSYAFIDALRTGELTRASAEKVRADLANASGVGRFDAVLERSRGQRVDSGMELESRDLFRAWGYEPWPEPFAFTCRDGVCIELDIAFPFEWISYEVHGDAFHSDAQTSSKDRKRWSEQTKDWSTGWIDRRRLDDDPMGIISDFRQRLAQVDPSRPPPPLPPLSDASLRVPAPILARTWVQKAQ